MKTATLGLGAALMATACSTIGVRTGTEEPVYRDAARVGDIEIRIYAPRIAAQTIVTGDSDAARNEGFRKLAGYIFGANAGRTSIAMTAPVAQSGTEAGAGRSETIAMTAPVAQSLAGAGRWTIQFFMPAAYAMGDLPAPRDPAVQLALIPAETWAVLRFSGVGSAPAVRARTAQLVSGLKDSGWNARGEAAAWFYDPPWAIPALRRNEVAIRVERDQPAATNASNSVG